MNALGPEPTFPVSACGRCGRDVLTHLVLDPDGEDRRRCLHCDADMDPAAVRWVLESELDVLGYGDAAPGGGCGGGCGNGGCGRG